MYQNSVDLSPHELSLEPNPLSFSSFPGPPLVGTLSDVGVRPVEIDQTMRFLDIKVSYSEGWIYEPSGPLF